MSGSKINEADDSPRRLPTVPVNVDIQRAYPPADLPANAQIERWVAHAIAGFRPDATVTVRVVDSAEGADLNERWRRRRGPTNVLSFPVSGLEALAPELLGDVVLCAPVAAAEAQAQGKTLDAHWAHLLVHGVLHLLGFDHEDDRGAAEMEEAERRLLAELGYADPYRECRDPS